MCDTVEEWHIVASAEPLIATLKETTTPTPLPGYGKLYTKSDNEFYFQDGDGVEHTFEVGAPGVKKLFTMPFEDPTGVVGNYAVVEINASQEAHFIIHVPTNFQSLVSVRVMMIPDTTETIQYDIKVSVAHDGEAHNVDDRSALNQTVAVTANLITHVDVSSVFSGLTTSDVLGIDFESDTATLRIIGAEINYN